MDLAGLTVSVVGGGIGGMAAATALAQCGAAVQVFEQAPALEEVGAGLQISANGQKVLSALGVDVQGCAVVSPGTQMRDGPSNQPVALVPAPRSGATWYVHRADLLAALVKAAEAAGVSVVLDRLVTPGTVQADVIVAADGAQSLWRNAVAGPVRPAFSGQVAWRALVPCDPPEDAQQPAVLAMGSRAHVVTYPLRGGALMNIVAVEERSGWSQEGWRQRGDPAEFRRRFAEFRGPARVWIDRAEDVHLWALHLRPVAEAWVKDGLALLGEAAHPTLPFMAQGACLALEDAWVLRQTLMAEGSVADGLQRYQSLRLARARAVVALARGNAWRFHLQRPMSWAAQGVLALGAGAMARRLEWVYGYDATQAV